MSEAEAAHGRETEKLHELFARRARSEALISECNSRLASVSDRHRDQINDAARAMIGGQAGSSERVQAIRSELREALAERPVLARAIQLQQQEVDAAKSALDAARRKDAEPAFGKLAQELADALVVVGDAADAMTAAFDELREQGTEPRPGVSISGIRNTVLDNKLNTLLDELEESFGVKVKRPARDAEVERRRRLAEAEAKRKKQTGCVEAGPQGVARWDRGKRVPIGARS